MPPRTGSTANFNARPNAIAHPIPPKHVKTSPTREVVLMGDEVDLYKLPIPMSSIFDGGPMITAGVVIARDPELGRDVALKLLHEHHSPPPG